MPPSNEFLSVLEVLFFACARDPFQEKVETDFLLDQDLRAAFFLLSFFFTVGKMVPLLFLIFSSSEMLFFLLMPRMVLKNDFLCSWRALLVSAAISPPVPIFSLSFVPSFFE